jgi:hypothetical protein
MEHSMNQRVGQRAGWRAGWLVAFAGVALSSVAIAAGPDDDDTKDHKQGFEQPLNGQNEAGGRARGNRSSTTTSIVTANNGKHEYKYEDKGGVVTVTRDGKKLNATQYRKTDDGVEFLDGDGNVEYRVDLPRVGGMMDENMRGIARLRPMRPQVGRIGPGPQGLQGLQGPQGFMIDTQKRPPVMLGVSLSTQGDDTVTGLIIEDVNEDGPAEKAGIKAGDRILFLDGQQVNSVTELRALLMDRKPGQKVDVKVDRDGQERVFTVELVKLEDSPTSVWNFNGEDNGDNEEMNKRLHELMGQQPGWLDLRGFTFTDRDVQDMKMVEEELEAAVESLRKNQEGGALGPEQRAELRDSLAKALEGVRRVREIQSDAGHRARGMIITPPSPPTPPNAMRGWNNQQNGEEDLQDVQDELRELREQLKEMRKELQDRKP